MKKCIYIGLLAFGFKINAQNNIPRTCGTPVLPQQFETWVHGLTQTVTPGRYNTGMIQSVFNIPVIVHIIHNNENVNSSTATSGNNLNAAQVVDQINILNKDYNGLNADTSLIPSIFKPVAGRMQVNFCLAVVNPTGGVMAEPGIDRVNRVAKGWTVTPYSQAYIDATVKPGSIWNPAFYLNIWVCPLGGGLLGYSTFPNPGTSGISGLSSPYGSSTTDGVVILNTSFGSVGTAQSGQYNKGRTTTHEIGHWMGLRHTWGDGTCASDYCNDTPPAQTANYGCPAFPHNLGTCTGNTTGEMSMNYMDYTDDACMYMFTADQKNRAQLILTNSPMRITVITSTVCDLPTITNDIGISFVSVPTYSQVINCLNNINPIINVTNFGSGILTSAVFSFNVDGVNTQTLSWTGSAAPNTSFTLALAQISNLTLGAHVFSVNVSLPNGGADNNPVNNNNTQNFSVTNNFSFNAPSGATCLGNSLVLTASGATTYSWSTGVTTASISLNPSVTTVYSLTGVTGICNLTKTVTVAVQTSPTLSLSKGSVCSGIPSFISASGASSYTWNTGETTAGISVTLSAPAVYTLSGATSAGCASTQTYNILVEPVPSSSISANNVSCSSCSDATLTAMASGGTLPYAYSWIPGNVNTQIISNVGIGCYSVIVTDVNGCSAVDSVCVSLYTGIFQQDLSASFIKILPNPSKGEFIIEFTSVSGTKKIEVSDDLGKLIKQTETASDTAPINLNAYADGIYYVKVISDKKCMVVKLIKKQ
jgi:hypothetical protein